jgi:hypothetical protein
MRRIPAIVLAALTWATVVQAQSLADLARQEEARRKAVASTGKVYTDDTLRAAPSTVPPQPASPAAKPALPETKTDAAAALDAKAAADPKKDEQYWRQRMTAARDALSRSQAFAEALQSRINALTTDFTNQDDPARRNQVSADRQKALAELDRVKKDIVEQTKAIADTQEEARKSSVPAGWVR